MLDYETIAEAYSLAEKAAAKKAAEPDEMDLAGAPLSGANKEEGVFGKIASGIADSIKKFKKNVKNVPEDVKKRVAISKENLKENLGIKPEPKGEVNKELLNKAASGALGKYDFGKPNIKENLNLPKPSTAPKKGISMTELHHKKEGNPYSMTGAHHQSETTPTPKKGISMTELHHKKEGNPYSMTGAHHQSETTPTTTTPEEHKEAAKGHLQKLLSQAKKVAEEHPAAAGALGGALGALAAGAGALGVKRLLSRKKKKTA